MHVQAVISEEELDMEGAGKPVERLLLFLPSPSD
jgi:hypothetical protein